MNERHSSWLEEGLQTADGGRRGRFVRRSAKHASGRFSVSLYLDSWIDRVAPCQWEASIASNPNAVEARRRRDSQPLYSAEERRRRDTSPWTIVQGVLAPIQFLAFAVSLALVVRFLMTGQGYALATGSILVKTALLYAIMITGSIWEKVVFGKWLFAKAFFWEDVCSLLVLGLQTGYVASLVLGWGSPREQLSIAIAAYAVYVINALQFLLKLRAARLEAAEPAGWRSVHISGTQMGGTR